jgi:hypothetical protein
MPTLDTRALRPGVSFVFPCRGGAIRTPEEDAMRFQVLHSRLRRSFRMTGCCAAKFHPAKPKPGSSGAPVLRGAAFLARGGSAREQTLPLIPLIPLMTLICTDLIRLGSKIIQQPDADIGAFLGLVCGTRGWPVKRGKSVMVSGCGFVKMAGFQ